MPLPINFDWNEDEWNVTFVLHVRGVKAKNVDIAVCDVYVKVNCHPALFDVDLRHEIDPDHPKTRCRVSSDRVTLTLRKREPGLWQSFRADGSKAELRERRQRALADAEQRELERLKKRDEWRDEKLKAGEHEQWRLDSENRERVENWEAEEKAKWEAEVYATFDAETGDAAAATALPAPAPEDVSDGAEGAAPPLAAPPAAAAAPPAGEAATPDEALPVEEEEAPPVAEIAAAEAAAAAPLAAGGGAVRLRDDEELEDYLPSVRDNPGKVGIRFSERPRPGVPVRDRGQRPPPRPKEKVTSDAPPMMAGDEPEDEADPVWLKDKADKLMESGDYKGAHNAYTEALKLALNARAFANRAVASLYMGNFEQSLEDCAHALRILDRKQQGSPGDMGGPVDPEDQLVRARLEVRRGVCYLWLGAFGKASSHLTKALEVQDGLDAEERRKVQEDLARVERAQRALAVKEKADGLARRAQGSAAGREGEILAGALTVYEEATEIDGESAVVHANASFAQLQAGRHEECLAAGEAALRCLKSWPSASRPPKGPLRPSRLDPPYLDDPTFRHPNEQKQGEVDWLMKHGGGTKENLPSLPPEYEWVKDASEKSGDAWIAIRKKMTKATIDAIRKATMELQDALYSRRPAVINQQIRVATDLNRDGEGPSNKAIRQATEYMEKLEAHELERQEETLREEQAAREELEAFDLGAALAASRAGVAQSGFGAGHPVERTRRRLFVKVLLRRARALALQGQLELAREELRSVLKVEPDNPEALAAICDAAPKPPEPAAQAAAGAPGEAEPTLGPSLPEVNEGATASGARARRAKDGRGPGGGAAGLDDADEADEEEDAKPDYASTTSLLAAAAEYMRRNDFNSALQIYNYASARTKTWESPATELKVLSNTSLCLQRLRGRLPELVQVCSAAVDRIAELRDEAGRAGGGGGGGGEGLPEVTLLRMEAACLSRRGSAYAQQKRTEESNRDAVRVREVLARIGELDTAAAHPAPAG